MADGTKIEWTDATWNPVTGCFVLSPGCKNCYAMLLAGTRLSSHSSRVGLTRVVNGNTVWTGEARFNDGSNGTSNWLVQPLQWRKPRMIFVCAHADLFYDAVPDSWIDQVFAVMAMSPQHKFQVLTKRSERMREYLINPEWRERVSAIINAWPQDKIGAGNDYLADFRMLEGKPLPNVWLGVSVEDQKHAVRIVDLLTTPAAVRWISAEPLLGELDLTRISTMRFPKAEILNALTGVLEGLFGDYCATRLPKLDWVVAGGESGPGARPMHPAWPVALLKQCDQHGTAFLFKQWGEYLPDVVERHEARSLTEIVGTVTYSKVGKKAAGRKLHGVEHNGYPA